MVLKVSDDILLAGLSHNAARFLDRFVQWFKLDTTDAFGSLKFLGCEVTSTSDFESMKLLVYHDSDKYPQINTEHNNKIPILLVSARGPNKNY